MDKELIKQSIAHPVSKSKMYANALDTAKAHVNLGNMREAANICHRILAEEFNHIDALNLLAILNFYAGNINIAISLLERVIAIDPNSIDGNNNLGEFYRISGNLPDAIKRFAKVLALDANNLNALINYGNSLQDIYRYEDAIVCYQKVLGLSPYHLGALSNLANLYQELNRYENAVSEYKKIIDKEENFDWALGGLLYSKLHLCDWFNYESDVLRIMNKVRQGFPVIKPFEFLAISDSPEDQYKCANVFVNKQFSKVIEPPYFLYKEHKRKIKVAYFSADFHDHATMHLMAEFFEKHNKEDFEIIAFSFGPDSTDKWRNRAQSSFDEFIDVRSKSDSEVAMLARKMEVDIAIDLKGYTTNSRPEIFLNRAAPIQVSYLGYPATMGLQFIDYLIADKNLILKSERKFYSEKIIYLPDTYQVNDLSQEHELHRLFKKDFGLPDSGFIFCCFNNSYKITPVIFDCWMRILKASDNSVLWLYDKNNQIKENLQKEAARRGVNPERLVFATHLCREKHLARLQLADLFLDTLPVNAHTTASDALRVGLPVLTLVGKSFAGRVASSLLNSIGLQELVVSSLKDYELTAIDLAQSAGKIQVIKTKLLLSIPSSSLYDVSKYSISFELALKKIYKRFTDGLAAKDFYI